MGNNLRDALVLVALGILVGVVIGLGIPSLITPTEEQVGIEDQVLIQEKGIETIYTQTLKPDLLQIRVIHDNKRNVTCWIIGSGYVKGLSCIPDHMLAPQSLEDKWERGFDIQGGQMNE